MELTDRQRELAEVALGIVAAEGMAAVTFRSVAAASGWSLGAVQKAFAAKDEMYAAMFATLRATEGVGPRNPPGQPTVQEWLTELVLTILPLDDRTRALTIQGAAFAERAAQDPAVGAAIATSDHELRGLLAALIAKGQADGEIPDSVSPATAAWGLLALAQGAASQLLYDRVDEQALTALVRASVAALLHRPTP
ncbi:MAG: TetR family transcriptional regulator C-terminal domain-containing protein [Actinobacteria bacterium]|nr:TetR family transcriptional regulator C-terminal domain-containing protein [Actinomycetota bacterium]